MADVNANIGVHIDTSEALAELKNLQRQLATFHASIAKGSAASALAQKNLQTNLLNAINSTGQFTAQMGLVRTSTESFTHALEKNKLGMRDYFRYAGASTKSFGRLFKQEFDTINKVAEDRVKKMQTQYIKMGRDANGAMKAMAITPTSLNMKDYATQTALAAQKQALFNQLVKQGSTNLLNFGKNTQWAGRQLMVGFTVPLAYLGTAAAKTFMDLEKQALKFKRVYGDMFTTTDETNKALEEIQKLAEGFTKYGVAVADTMEMAASAAAMGKTGAELTAQVAEATRLAVLGGVEQEQALETTISLTNAFGVAAEDLSKKINFLNSVENQTVVSIEDLTIAIPKAGPVIQQLGGDVEDLAFFLTAMKEGGINASEGANALKSGLASLINPSKKAAGMLSDLGINIKAIVEGNNGNIRQTVIDFSRALDTLDPLNRARAIEQLFGKFQFSRLSTLFQNVTKDGTQASKVLGLAAASVEELAILSERELKTVEDAIGTNFKAAVEDLKVTLAPIGKEFLKAVTPIVKVAANLLEKFDGLGEGTKKFIVIATSLVGILGPTLLMTFGLVANGAANIIKLFLALRTGFMKLGGNSKILADQTNYMTTEQLEAATVATSLNQAHTRLTQSFTAEASAVRALRQAYIDATVAAANFARSNPGMMVPGKGKVPKKFGKGTRSVPGTGNKDNVPAVLTPGEAVLPTRVSQNPKYQPIIDAMLNGTLQTYGSGTNDAQPFSNSPKFVSKTYLPPQIVDTNPSQINRLQAGLPGLDTNGPTVAEKSAALLARMQAKKASAAGASIVGETGIQFDGALYNAKSARGAKGVKDFIDSLIKNPDGSFTYIDENTKKPTTISRERLREVLNYRSQPGKNLTSSDIKRSLDIGSGARGSGRGTSRPAWIAKLMADAKSNPNVLAEETAVKEALAKKGVTRLTQSQEKNLFGLQASHVVEDRSPEGIKRWAAANIVPEPGYINNYINTVKGKLGKELLSMSDDKLASLSIDRAELRKIASGAHPTTANAANTLKSVAQYQIAKNPNAAGIYQAEAVVAGIDYRMQNNTYKGGLKTLARLFPANKKVMQEVAAAKGETQVDSKGRERVLTGQNTRRKPVGVQTTSRNVADNRITKVGRGGAILPKGMRIPGAIDGFTPNGGGSATDRLFQSIADERKAKAQSIKIVDAEAQFRAEQKSLRRQIEKLDKIKVAEQKKEIKEQRKQSETRKQINKIEQENLRDKKRDKQNNKMLKQQSRMGKIQGVGMAAGMASTAAYMTGNTGAGNALMGISVLSQIGPMLATPMGILATTLVAAGAAALKFNHDVEKARKEGVELGRSMSMTSEKLQSLAEITGTVSATELAGKKRENLLSGEDAVQRKFGQNILGSEFGKKLMSDIEAQAQSGRSVTQIGENISNSLAYAVVQGVISGDQAKSISAALGEELKSYEIPAIVTGNLVNLLGPNGENLAKNPLQIAIKIQKKSMETQAEAFQSAISNRQDTRTAGGGLMLAGGAAAGIGAMAATGILAPVAAVASVALIGKALYDQNKIKAQNMKLDAAATEMGIQQIVMNNGIVDSLNKQYDEKLKTAQTEAEIQAIEGQRAKALEIINKKNSSALDLLIAQKDQLSKGAFDKGINSAIDALYKDGPMKAFADQAKQMLSQGKDSKFKTMLQIELASGGLDPITVMKLVNNPNLSGRYDLVVSAQGTGDTNMLFQLLMKAGIEDQKLPIMLDLFAKDPANFDKNIAALSTLANMQQKYGITIDLNDDGPEQIKEVLDITNKLSGITGEELSKEVFFGLGVTGDMTKEEMDKLWTSLVGTSSTINKKVVVDFVAAGDRNVLDFYYKSKGITRLRGRSAAGQDSAYADSASAYLVGREGKAEEGKLPGGSSLGGGDGARDKTFDDILNDLKRTRDATINASGGAKELLRILSGKKDITIFNGLDQQLSKLGANSDFIDWIGGIDDAIRNKLIKVTKQGVVALTELGKASKKAFDEKQLGLYSASASDAINSAKAQRSAFVALSNAGLDVSSILGIIEDGNIANAIANNKNAGEILKLVKQEKEKKKQMELTSAMTEPKKFLEDINNELDRQYNYQKKLMDLQRGQAEAKISGDYIGAAQLGQEQSYETSQFARESSNIDLSGKVATMQQALKIISGSNIKDKSQKALMQSSLNQGMLGLSQLGSFNPTFGYAPQFAGINPSSGFNGKPTSTTDSSGSVYNIQMTVNGNNATADDIANQVINKINLVSRRNNKTNSVGAK